MYYASKEFVELGPRVGVVAVVLEPIIELIEGRRDLAEGRFILRAKVWNSALGAGSAGRRKPLFIHGGLAGPSAHRHDGRGSGDESRDGPGLPPDADAGRGLYEHDPEKGAQDSQADSTRTTEQSAAHADAQDDRKPR